MVNIHKMENFENFTFQPFIYVIIYTCVYSKLIYIYIYMRVCMCVYNAN